MSIEQQDNLCLALTGFAVAIPLAYLVLTSRWPSRLSSYGRSLAWWFALCSPIVMGIGYFDAVWPYGDDNAPSQHQFRWDWLAFDVGVGFLVVFCLGVFTGFLATCMNGEPGQGDRIPSKKERP